MEQRKRHGGTGGLGYYTSWEKNSKNGCIYCGSPADTREHTPSKVFLVEPFPENLPTIPACFKCNNGYSDDEKYVSCFLDVLKSYIYEDYSYNSKTIERLEKDTALKNLLDEQIKSADGKIYIKVDKKRLVNILIKLAKGHAGFEMDKVNFDEPQNLWYDFIFNLQEEQIKEFNCIPISNVINEIGSRTGNTPCVIQNVETGEAFIFNDWNDVQDNQYRYQVSLNDEGGITVKLVIFEFLYCEVIFD